MLHRLYNKKLMAKVVEAAKACSIDNRLCTVNDIINLEIYIKEYQIINIDESYKIKKKSFILK